MQIEFNVQEPYKTLMLIGEKKIEARLNKGKFWSLKIGDSLRFDDTGEVFEVRDLTYYSAFQVMLEQEGLKNVLPWVRSIEEWVAVYHKFYTLEQETEFWVVAILIEKMKKE